MSTFADELISHIKDLPVTEKLRLVDAILTELDNPDPEIDRIGPKKRGSVGSRTRPDAFPRSRTKR
ncbi:MAG TPA: hypothetical protein VK582_04060 [Pyrinomonadaceae bacterium]|nr:hypothetical protein [Pyrinomonadaceae bacterium]